MNVERTPTQFRDALRALKACAFANLEIFECDNNATLSPEEYRAARSLIEACASHLHSPAFRVGHDTLAASEKLVENVLEMQLAFEEAHAECAAFKVDVEAEERADGWEPSASSDVPTCPGCGEPAHAAESDDDDYHEGCRPVASTETL